MRSSPSLPFSFGEVLARMYASDSAANGLFVTGVLTTGIYCLPSCPARKPKAENVMFFATEVEAVENDLRPCKPCRPDQYFAGEDPDRERLFSVLSTLERDPSLVPDVAALADRVGVGLSKLHTLARRYTRTSPGELIHAGRIGAAKRLLRSSGAGAAETAFAVGYESVSTFYKRFKQTTGVTPGAFARNARLEGAADAVHAEDPRSTA